MSSVSIGNKFKIIIIDIHQFIKNSRNLFSIPASESEQ